MKCLLLSILILSVTAHAEQPVYNFNFFNKTSNKKNIQVEKNVESEKKMRSLDQRTSLPEMKATDVTIGKYNGYLRSLSDGYFNSSYSFGIQQKLSPDSSLSYILGVSYLRHRDRQEYYDYYGEIPEGSFAYGRRSVSVGPVWGIHHGTDIKSGRYFGIFHEFETQLLYEKGQSQEYMSSVDCFNQGTENERCFTEWDDQDLKSFERLAGLVAYRAGLKINLMLFWVTPYYEAQYTENLLGDRLTDAQAEKFRHSWGLKIELPL